MIGVFLAKKAIIDTFEALNQHNLPKLLSVLSDDVEYIYGGDIPNMSGTFRGKGAIEDWWRSFFDLFPQIEFDIQHICFQNIFDFTGTNVAAIQWDLQFTRRDGLVGKNSGVTVFEFKRGKLFFAKEFIFDQGENFKRNWGAI